MVLDSAAGKYFAAVDAVIRAATTVRYFFHARDCFLVNGPSFGGAFEVLYRSDR